MTEVDETKLPGVGVRHDFVTYGGQRVGLLTHISGKRELLLYDAEDPDRCRASVDLQPDDVRVLAELLAADRLSEHLAGLREATPGLAIDWLVVGRGSPHAGQALGASGLLAPGAAAVAIVRGDEALAAPDEQLVLAPGDVVVLAGAPAALRAAFGDGGDSP